MRPLKYKKIFGGTYIKWSCSPDTGGRCFCRSCRPRCSSGQGMTLSSSRGSRGMWWGRGCLAAERPGWGDRGWWRRTAPSPSWWGGSGLLASSRTLDCVLTELRVMFWSRIWWRLTRVLWEQPGPGQHQPPARPSQCASTGVACCYTLGHHKMYLLLGSKVNLVDYLNLKVSFYLTPYIIRVTDKLHKKSCAFLAPWVEFLSTSP